MIRTLSAIRRRYPLKIVCSFDDNICIYSCHETGEQRADELQRFIGDNAIQPLAECGGAKEYVKERHGITLKASYWVMTVVMWTIGCTCSMVAAIFSVLSWFYTPMEPTKKYALCIYCD